MVFEQSTSIKEYPFVLFYRPIDQEQQPPVRVAFTVSKKRFKRAVDRNKIKRLMREAYRKNKFELTDELDHQKFHLVFVYIGKKIETYQLIEKQIQTLLRKLVTL